MGVFQLPDSVYPDAIGCIVYSFLCLLANVLLVWLIWTQHERMSYVAFIAYFTLLATVTSIVQQLYDYILWENVMTQQFLYAKTHADNAETQYQRGLMGLKLALSYVRIFCFNVESSLVFFFSLSLAATVYGWWSKEPQTQKIISINGRILPVAVAVVSIVLLQLDFSHKSFITYLCIANAQLVLSLVGSCVFLLMILGKYLQSRRQLKTWTAIKYGKSGTSTVASEPSRRSRAFSSGTKMHAASFDNWLVMRLTIAFLTLCVFEYTNLAPRFSAKSHVVESVDDAAPDLSRKRALQSVRGYLSGVSPSMLAFVVFGTTRAFQRRMYRTLVPAFVRRRLGGGDQGHVSQQLLPFSTVRASTFGGGGAAPRPARHTRSASWYHHQQQQQHKADDALAVPSVQSAQQQQQQQSLEPPKSPLRLSQIGLAIGELPRPQPAKRAQATTTTATGDYDKTATFLDDDSYESLPLPPIPLSKFNSRSRSGSKGVP